MENRRKKIVICLLLTIIIILLILIILSIKYIGQVKLIPTGNIDIFDITCNKDDKKPDVTISNDSSFEKDNLNNKCLLNNINWDSTNKLRIFSNPSYEYKEMSELSNVYQFVINNSQEFNIKYNINFIEENKYQINMLYRLKRNGKYLLGSEKEWIKIPTNEINNLQLLANTRDTYSLEWKLVDNENVNNVSYLEENYTLNINIKANTQND